MYTIYYYKYGSLRLWGKMLLFIEYSSQKVRIFDLFRAICAWGFKSALSGCEPTMGLCVINPRAILHEGLIFE